MMKCLPLFLVLVLSPAMAYVPTVESLFRHGSNPDVSANGLSMTLVVRKAQLIGEKSTGILQDVSLVKDKRPEDFYKVFFSRDEEGEILKVAQTRYSGPNFSEASLEHKIYYPNFTPYTIRPNIEEVEKGIFFSLLRSIALNDGAHLISYLKALSVPVKLNTELINRDKIELLAQYKSYLVAVAKDRNARKTEENPLRPEDPETRERVEKLMDESMYVDTKQVRLGRDNGEIAWLVNAGTFEAVVSYKDRHPQRIKYKSAAGDFEIICKDYWLANGSHSMPKFLQVRTLSGETYMVEIKNFRHYVEKEEDLINRLKKWDEALKGKLSQEPRVEFLL